MLDHLSQLLAVVSLAIGILLGVAKILHWLYKKIKALDVTQDFVHAIATNHLPHVYHAQLQQGRALVKIAEKLDVEVQIDENDPPPISFIAEKRK